ncbi:MAG: hydrogenase 4 subunit B [Acidobacteriia bacterium]|nr:hydrogenase 4 subunit B [Terriglobia bacterium]
MLTASTGALFILLLAALGVAVPLILIASRAQGARRLAIALILTAGFAGCVMAVYGFLGQMAPRLDLSWATPFPFSLAVDRLSAFFLLLVCAVTIPVTIFAAPYFDLHYSERRRNWTWALFSLFVLSMIVVVTAATGFAFLVGWELMTLVSAGLILIEGDSTERRHNVFIYLLMMHVGAAAVAACFFLFLPYSHGLDFGAIRASGAGMPGGIRAVIFLAAFVGFGAKAGLIPLHLWLPRAHPIAPSPVSALMSGIMLKTAVYGFVRFTFDFLGGGPWWSGYVVLVVAAVTGLLGILYAIAENDLKRLLAYSSVENIGIIFLGLGTSLLFLAHGAPLGAALALVAALFHTFNHALFKSLLFLGAGAISNSTHSVNLNELGGLQRRMPLTGAAVLIGCCSIAGLPLFNGFVSEWLTFRSFLAGSALINTKAQIVLPLMVGILALIGGLAAACFVKTFGTAFLGRPRSMGAEHAEEAPLGMRAGLVLLGAGCLALGIFPGLLLRPLVTLAQALLPGAGVPEETLSIARIIPWTAAIVLGTGALVALFKRRERLARTWACGLPGLSSRMEYTSTVFSKPIRFVFARVYRPDRKVEELPADQPYFPVSISYRSVRTTSYERVLYRPFVEIIISLAYRVRRLQTGNIQVYLLYIFLALVSLLTFLRFQR